MAERHGRPRWIPEPIWRLVAGKDEEMPERKGRLLGRLDDAGRFRSPEEAREARERAGVRLPEPGTEPDDIDRVSREDNAAMREFFRQERREAGVEDAD